MLFYEFNVGDKEYKLRLNTKNIISLEKQLGCNPLSIFGDGSKIPTVSVMTHILHYSLVQYQSNISFNDACDIFDKWLEEGHSITDFITIILEIYKVSGLIGEEVEDTEKN